MEYQPAKGLSASWLVAADFFFMEVTVKKKFDQKESRQNQMGCYSKFNAKVNS
jgi:hypothetical protein